MKIQNVYSWNLNSKPNVRIQNFDNNYYYYSVRLLSGEIIVSARSVQEVFMKQKEIKPHRNVRPYKCDSNFLSKLVESPEATDNYYCVDEVEKSHCNVRIR